MTTSMTGLSVKATSSVGEILTRMMLTNSAGTNESIMLNLSLMYSVMQPK